MKIMYVESDGTMHHLPGVKCNLFALPDKDFVLPDGVRISIFDERPYKPGANNKIVGRGGGFARLTTVDRKRYANPGGQGDEPGHTKIEVLALTVEEAYELLERVDEVLETEVITIERHPLRARFRDVWGRFWGYTLERLENWTKRRPLHKEARALQKEIEDMIKQDQNGQKPLSQEHFLSIASRLQNLTQRMQTVSDAMVDETAPIKNLDKVGDLTKSLRNLLQSRDIAGTPGWNAQVRHDVAELQELVSR